MCDKIPLSFHVSDIYGELNDAKGFWRNWLNARNDTNLRYVMAKIDSAKSLTAMALNDPSVSGENKAALKEAVTVIIDLLLDPQTEDGELERWLSLLARWFGDPHINRPGFRLKIPREMRKQG